VSHLDDEDEELSVWLPRPIVFLQDEQVYAIVLSYGTYVSRVKYTKDGVSYEVIVENEDIVDLDGEL
jgi:hypothetical protein